MASVCISEKSKPPMTPITAFLTEVSNEDRGRGQTHYGETLRVDIHHGRTPSGRKVIRGTSNTKRRAEVRKALQNEEICLLQNRKPDDDTCLDKELDDDIDGACIDKLSKENDGTSVDNVASESSDDNGYDTDLDDHVTFTRRKGKVL